MKAELIRDQRYLREDYRFNDHLIEFESDLLKKRLDAVIESSVLPSMVLMELGKVLKIRKL